MPDLGTRLKSRQRVHGWLIAAVCALLLIVTIAMGWIALDLSRRVDALEQAE